MKLKMYLRMLLAAVAALFVATACGDSDEETNNGGGGGGTTEPVTLQIAVSDIEGSNAKLNVTSSDQLATYYWNAVKKSIYDGLGSDKAFLDDDLAFIQQDATNEKMTLSAYLQWKTGRGTATYTVTGLEANTEYYAYVYGINYDGTVTTDLVKELFTSDDGTGGGGGEDDPFAISISNVGATSAEASIVPKDKSGLYFVNRLDEEGYQEVGSVMPEFIEEFFLYQQEQNPTMSMAQIVTALTNSGDKKLSLGGLIPETKYYAFVIGVNTEGKVTTEEVFAEPFTTTEAATGAPTFTLTTTKGDYDGLNPEHNFVTAIQCTSANAAKAWYYPISKAEYDALIAKGETAETLIQKEGVSLDRYISGINGAGLQVNTPQCVPGTEYCMIMRVASADGASTTKTITATTDGTPASVTFDMNISNITSTGCKATVTPSNDTDKYFATIQKGVVAAYDDRMMVEALEYAYTEDGSKFSEYLISGEGSLNPTTLIPNTEYILIVFGHDGIGATTVVSRKFFTTTGGGQTSDLTFDISVTDITHKSANITILPSDNAAYYFSWYFKKEVIDSFESDAQAMATIISANMPEDGSDFTTVCDQGPVRNWVPSNLESETQYYVICFGYSDGGASTPLTKYPFTTIAKKQVTSTLFEDLLGSWTATMTDSDGQSTFDVTIAAGVNEATTAAYRKENYLVCLGFNAYTYYAPETLVENGWTADEAYQDYGPKWFLEISEGDVVTVPTDMTHTLHNWSQTTTGPVYLLGCNGSNLFSGGKYFPVEISENKNTITVKGYTDSEYPGTTFYPSSLYQKDQSWRVAILGKSDIVLTRKAAGVVSSFLTSGARKDINKELKRTNHQNSLMSVVSLDKAEVSVLGEKPKQKIINKIPYREIGIDDKSNIQFSEFIPAVTTGKLDGNTIESTDLMLKIGTKFRSVRNE